MADFWKNFDKLMNSLPKYIDDMIKDAKKSVSHSYTSEASMYMNGKDKVVIENVNGKTTVTVNGKKYVEK